MAVQKSRKSRSRRGMKRAHNALTKPTLSIDSTTGETHLRHHISPRGYYRGRQVIAEQVHSHDHDHDHDHGDHADHQHAG